MGEIAKTQMRKRIWEGRKLTESQWVLLLRSETGVEWKRAALNEMEATWGRFEAIFMAGYMSARRGGEERPKERGVPFFSCLGLQCRGRVAGRVAFESTHYSSDPNNPNWAETSASNHGLKSGNRQWITQINPDLSFKPWFKIAVLVVASANPKTDTILVYVAVCGLS